MTTRTNGALTGVRVLDFTSMMSGPYCTRLLADLGAEVIKIEPPEGDYMRMRVPLREGRSTYFGQLNCGKKSIVLDLKSAPAKAAVRELVAKSDVLVENFRPGVMKRLGLGYESLADVNPRLVYCSISGFGQEGPWAQRTAYAPVLHAASGYDLANMSYQTGLDRPLKAGLHVADVLGGALAFGAIQAALVGRNATGLGDHVDLSLMDSMLGSMMYECQTAQFPSDHPRAVFQPTRASDGFVLIAPVSQNTFEALARATGHPEWITDPRFSNARSGAGNKGSAREQNWAQLMDLLDEWASTRSAAECEAVLSAGGVPCSRYLSIGEAMREPAIVERGSFATIDDGAGPFQVPNPAFQMRNSLAEARDGVPALGADTAAVLADVLGYTPQQAAALRAGPAA